MSISPHKKQKTNQEIHSKIKSIREYEIVPAGVQAHTLKSSNCGNESNESVSEADISTYRKTEWHSRQSTSKPYSKSKEI